MSTSLGPCHAAYACDTLHCVSLFDAGSGPKSSYKVVSTVVARDGRRMAPPLHAKGVVVWLHDLGERDANGFSSLAKPHAPWITFSCPLANARPVGCREGPTTAWFELDRLPVTEPPEVAPEGLWDSIKAVHERLEYLSDAMSIDSTRILLGGFGQGGALALAAGLTYRKQLSGILSHSGWVCQPVSDLVNLKGSANAAVPIMLISGLNDEMVSPAAVQASARALRTAGMRSVIEKSFEGLEHKMSEQSLGLTIDFIRTRVPATSTSAAPVAAAAVSGARSSSVITMNRGGSGPPTPPAAPPAPPAAPPTPPTVPPPAPPAAAVPKVTAVPKPTAVPKVTAGPKPTAGPKTAAAMEAEELSALSPDDATARALRAGDKSALEQALARRGDEAMSHAEMRAITEVMLADANPNLGTALTLTAHHSPLTFHPHRSSLTFHPHRSPLTFPPHPC